MRLPRLRPRAGRPKRITDRPRWYQAAHAVLADAAQYIAIALSVVMVLLVLHVERRQDATDRHQRATEGQLQRVARAQLSEATRLAIDRLFLQESCTRLDILRVEDNASHYEDFLVFSAVYREFFSRHPADPASRAVLIALRNKSWTPRTNCKKAVNTRGIRYRAPQPIRFVSRLPSPYDLKPPIGER